MQDSQVQSLGGEDPLEKETATHQYSCLGNSMDRSAWLTTVHEVAILGTRLSNYTYNQSSLVHISSNLILILNFYRNIVDLATHSSIIALRIPWTGAW